MSKMTAISESPARGHTAGGHTAGGHTAGGHTTGRWLRRVGSALLGLSVALAVPAADAGAAAATAAARTAAARTSLTAAGAAGGSAAAAAAAEETASRPKPPAALGLTSVVPAAGTSGVGATAPIVLTFSAPLAAATPLPQLEPSTAGSWAVQGDKLVFRPRVPFIPLSVVTVTVPGGRAGVKAASGARLAKPVSTLFHVQDGSTVRLQQLLSILAYSPIGFTQQGTPIPASDTAAQIAAMYQPPAGTWSWSDHGWPAQLTSLWRPGIYNVFTRGLVMEFEADFLLIVNGERSPGLWNDLLRAVTLGYRNTGGYDYALGDKQAPESLTIWHDGTVVLKAPANTGVAADPTPDGNFNVFARYRSQVMHGTNPDGQKYADPVQYVAYFNGGDAVHYLARADYGIPQSLGCIELSLADAAKAWPYLAYGTIVSVIG